VNSSARSVSAPGTRVRSVEMVLAVFFLYTSVLALVMPVAFEIRVRTLIVNAVVFAFYAFLATLEGGSRERWALPARDWCALVLVLLAYKQMGWFAPPVHQFRLEQEWIAWDRLILVEWGFKNLIDGAGSGLLWLLELTYLLVYAVGPFGAALLYLERRRHDRVRTFLLIYVLGLFMSYVQFPFWPSEPPRTVFPGDLEPLNTAIRRVNLFVVGNAGIHTSVFPSGHVSGVFAAAFAMWTLLKDRIWVRSAFLIYACLVAIAAFYGRYHYFVDVIAGFFVAVAAVSVARVLIAREDRVRGGVTASALPRDLQPT
jgi:membrane-associated phospholipid phosphatase